MKSLVLGCLAAGLGASLVVVGCGDDDGSGGSEPTTTATSTTGTTSPTTTSSMSTPTSTSSGTGQCMEITIDDLARFEENLFAAEPMLGGAGEDVVNLEFYGDTLPTGTIDLGAGGNANYGTCTTCILAGEDLDTSTADYAKAYFQTSGTIELGATSAPFIVGTLTDVTLVEVTLAPAPDFTSTPVAGGACLHIASATIDFPAPPAAWVCEDLFYAQGLPDDCDCGCGSVDPDCADANASSCDFCNDPGSCAEGLMDCSTINATNNAVCQ